MIAPNPPHKAATNSDRYMHRADALDGTGGEHGVNLYYRQDSKVLNSKIYQLGIGAPNGETTRNKSVKRNLRIIKVIF